MSDDCKLTVAWLGGLAFSAGRHTSVHHSLHPEGRGHTGVHNETNGAYGGYQDNKKALRKQGFAKKILVGDDGLEPPTSSV